MTKYNSSNGQFEHFCDHPKHNKLKKACGIVSIRFGEGSKHGFAGGVIQICDECAEEFLKHFKKEFNKKLKEIPEI